MSESEAKYLFLFNEDASDFLDVKKWSFVVYASDHPKLEKSLDNLHSLALVLKKTKKFSPISFYDLLSLDFYIKFCFF